MLFSYSDLIRKSARSENERFYKIAENCTFKCCRTNCDANGSSNHCTDSSTNRNSNRCSNGQLDNCSNRNSSGSSNKLTDRYRQLIPERTAKPLLNS